MGRLRQFDRRAPLAVAASLAAVIALLCVGSVGSAAAPAAGMSRACDAPRLAGLTLAKARMRARRSGCRLLVKGAKLEQASVQTVRRQSPTAGRRSSSVTVWLNPFCHGSAAYGPEIEEPKVTAGPTELISGFYVVGGPLRLFSTPGCRLPEPQAGAGTVEVRNAAGALVASVTSTSGHLVEIPLPAGSYTIRGTFLQAEINSARPTRSESLVIPTGHTVRQDFFLDVP